MNDQTPGSGRDGFASRIGFVLSAAGSAIGLGNIWRFPYTAGEGGGAAFVLVYVFFVLTLGFPVMMAEFAIGQATRRGAVQSFEALFPGSRWSWIGRVGIAAGYAIFAFYSAVAGWALGYLVRSLSGAFSAPVSAEASGELFSGFIASPAASLPATGVIIGLSALVVLKGVGKGIERASFILMPVFFLLLLGLAVHSLMLPGAGEGLAFLFKPDLSKLSVPVVMSALGQSFFSLSIGMGVMITYGSYLDRRESRLSPLALSSIGADTLVALLAGLIIFPAIFTAGLKPAGGPGLAFVTLPTIFSTLPMGSAIASAFYALLVIAALTSTVSIIELIAADLVGRKGWHRSWAVLLIACAGFLLAIPCALSFGGSDFFTHFLGIPDGFFGLLNAAFGNLVMVLGGFFICLFVGWKWGMGRALAALGIPEGSKMAALLSFAIRWLCPAAIAAVMGFILITGKFF